MSLAFNSLAPQSPASAASPPTGAAVIEAVAVTKAFGTKSVLMGTDLVISAGQTVGLLGTNGAGKSTLLKCLLGLLKPSSGRCRVLGEDSWNLSEAAKARIGYVPQQPEFYPWMTVDQTLRYLAAFYPRWDWSLTNRLLADWQVDRRARVGVMSPGQQQKLALIAALGFGPEVLILDEPAAALDPVARREFLQELLSLGEGQRTVLFSTHITSDLERVASHVAVLKDGQLPYFDELDVLKERVKRLRIRSEQALPAQLKVPGQFRSEVTGSNAVLSVDFADAALIQRLEQQFDAEIEVEDLNLEEIFLEIHHVA